jgi:transcriptional regulator with XRE-family HTH domain
MDELQQALGEEIRNRRLELKDVTQDTLAIRSGVSRATIANIERGRQSVTIGILYRLSRELGVDAGTILNRSINKTYPETDRTILLSDVDNKQEVLNTLNKYI